MVYRHGRVSRPVEGMTKPAGKSTGVSIERAPDRYRVLHIITRLIRGGADSVVLDLIANLDHERFAIDLMVGGQSELQRIHVPKDVNSLIFIPSLVREINPLYDIPALRSIYRTIKDGQYDIVHTHTAKAGFLGRLAARLARTPYVIHHLHGTTFPPTMSWPTRRFYISLEHLAARWCDTIIPVGNDLAESYLAQYIGRPEQYHVIHYPADLEAFLQARELTAADLARVRESLGVAPDDVVIGKVARLEKRKGFDYYIEAAKRLAPKHRNVKFLIVGEGDQRGDLQNQVDRAQLNGQVIFTGYRNDIAEVMATFDIFAFTSLWEGLPKVMVESAALGKPIVTFAVEGAREMVDDGETGYIVPSRDVDALAQRLEELSSDRLLRERMSACMLERFAPESWSLRGVVSQITDIYEEHALASRG